MNKVESTIKKIRELTGIEVRLYPYSKSEVLNAIGNFENSVCEKDDKIYFIVEASGKNFVGNFTKTGEKDVEFARLFIHLLEEKDDTGFSQLSYQEKIKRLVMGETSVAQRYDLKREIGDVFNYYAVLLLCESKEKRFELEEFISAMQEKDDTLFSTSDTMLIYLKANPKGYENSEEFVKILYTSIKEELRIELHVSSCGEIKNFKDLSTCYEKNNEALFYGKTLYPTERIYSYKDFALVSLFSKMPISELTKIFERLAGDVTNDVWSDDELLSTASTFIRCSLNVSETSRVMYIHRNTLMYRLDKIKRETGYDIHNFSDAHVFYVIDLIRKIMLNEFTR